MNWLPKFDALMDTTRAVAANHWEVGVFIALAGVLFALVNGLKDGEKEDAMRKKARILRYCHDCPFADNYTETCTIKADSGEKCGLIDGTAGMKFDVVKK